MKKYILQILALAIILTACGNTEPPTTFSEETEALFREYMPYLVDNYEEGKIVLFEAENGNIEEMRVSTNDVITQICIIPEEEGDDKERKGAERRMASAVHDEYVKDVRIMGTYLEERRTACTGFGAAIQLLPSGEQINVVDARTNREAVTPLRTPAPSPTDNTIVLQTDAGWCVLERGVGIVQIADTLGHTWKLVE